MNSYRIGVRVLPKDEILDIEGETLVKHECCDSSIEKITSGKYYVLNIKASNLEDAYSKALKITYDVLCNSLIEIFMLEVI